MHIMYYTIFLILLLLALCFFLRSYFYRLNIGLKFILFYCSKSCCNLLMYINVNPELLNNLLSRQKDKKIFLQFNLFGLTF